MKYERAFEFEATSDYVELRFVDGTILRIDRYRAEIGIIKTVSDQIAMDELAYNNPFA